MQTKREYTLSLMTIEELQKELEGLIKYIMFLEVEAASLRQRIKAKEKENKNDK